MGFEPTLGYKPKHAFQACALNHSATPPLEQLSTLYIGYLALPVNGYTWSARYSA